jgi:aspartate kinase
LVLSGLQARFQDVREWIVTEEPFREARIVWEDTEKILQPFVVHPNSLGPLTITQGFIGQIKGTHLTSTLGREGSDYTGAILASALHATSLTIWKDVAGVMNADPRLFPDAVKFDVLSYREAIEMTYYGATVIHPKTIKPLENKQIPLEVNSFLRPDLIGTVISADAISIHHTPCYIVVKNQILLSISSKDFSFIAEPGLSAIFQSISEVGLRVRLMQNSAISFSVVLDNDTFKIPGLLQSLKEKFRVKFNENVELWTIRHYSAEVIQKTTEGRTILMEQRNRETAQFVMETK